MVGGAFAAAWAAPDETPALAGTVSVVLGTASFGTAFTSQTLGIVGTQPPKNSEPVQHTRTSHLQLRTVEPARCSLLATKNTRHPATPIGWPVRHQRLSATNEEGFAPLARIAPFFFLGALLKSACRQKAWSSEAANCLTSRLPYAATAPISYRFCL